MAKIIEGNRATTAWLNGVKHLAANGGQARNLILELSEPTKVGPGDRDLIASVDAALRMHADLTVNTVAGTIFPYGMYRRYGRPGLYKEFLDAMKVGQKRGTWGTYAMRIMARRGNTPGEVVNPLQDTIAKLVRATTGGKPFQAVYEVGVSEPAEDLDIEADVGVELPTFDAGRDGKMVSNMPCLSHLSFKLTGKDTIDLSVMYRSHYYLERALGNLIGLGQLMQFVAKESKLKVGTLTCMSTHAVLNYPVWGGKPAAKKLLQSLNVAD